MSNFLADIPPDQPLAPGRYGAVPQNPGVKAVYVAPAMATLSAGRHDEGALTAAIASAFGATLPSGPRFAAAGSVGFVGIGAGRWTVVADGLDGETLEKRLAEAAGSAGSVCDQSDGSVIYEISGPDVRAALAKLLEVDIDPVVFATGSAATTRAALIGVTFWQVADAPVYRFAVARSYGPAFLRALAAAAAEYGFELV